MAKLVTGRPGLRVIAPCTFQVELVSAGEGRCLCKLKVGEEHTNPGGTLHGGMTASMVDTISTMALLTTEPHAPGVSVDLSVS